MEVVVYSDDRRAREASKYQNLWHVQRKNSFNFVISDFVLAKLKKLKKEKILENGDDYEVCTV